MAYSTSPSGEDVAQPVAVAGPTLSRVRRCASVYPGLATLNGKSIRCELPAGHVERHGHSFAARYWDGAR